ncbi:DNA polymerase [Roseococcus sp.]|uniref:DNA polymerase n=1 Tax=Roseococcus sp. TaxID=2109646 RepID=UPI003BAC4BC6
MRYLHYTPDTKPAYPVCFLVPRIAGKDIEASYLRPHGVDPNEVLVLSTLSAPAGKKAASKKEVVSYIEQELMPVFTDFAVEYIVVTDAAHFKTLTKTSQVDPNLGYVLPSIFGDQKVVYIPNFQTIFYDPDKVKAKIAQGLEALQAHRQGTYQPPGTDVLKSEHYPLKDEEIQAWLDQLLAMNCPLAIDIEGFSLRHTEAGIGTISFAWNQHEGIAFPVDYVPDSWAAEAPYGKQVRNEARREMLRKFFRALKQKAIYHHIAYDAYVLIYQLFMKDILDTEGLLDGMSVLLRDWDCTKLISYFATNSAAGNQLGLKVQSQEFAGNYSMDDDIKDITKIPLPKLLRYNLVDTCSTWYVHNKHWGTVVADQQVEVYETIFKPATLDIVQMQLTGLPVNMAKVIEANAQLETDYAAALAKIHATPIIQAFTHQLNEDWVEKRNSELKVKRVSLADAKEVFNPDSDPQMRRLLYEVLAMPVIDLTDTKLPAAGAKTIEKLINHTTKPELKELLRTLLDYASIGTILSTFMPSFLNAVQGPDGWHYLFGGFNLGGTISGRLSSSNPNLQNLPAGAEGEDTLKGRLGKLIKMCVEAPEGWLFVGLDFDSLEDKISAKTTRDPNKLKVYTDGYDGHCLRAFAYFKSQMPDIIDTVESINSIAKKYKPLRQKSKVPTFLLTYGGTWMGMTQQTGLPKDEAIAIEKGYHELYFVSDQWVKAKLKQAEKDGYITVAFGLRVRTPLLAQVIAGNRSTPYEATAEGRSAGNAFGQSWGLLNSRACSEFMGRVREEEFQLDIRPCCHIHDAQYYLIRDDTRALAYTNEHLVTAVNWQDHPDIRDELVPLGGQVSIFWPNWAHEITIPNGANENEIAAVVEKALAA